MQMKYGLYGISPTEIIFSLVHVLPASCGVGYVVVGDKVDLVLGQEVVVGGPRRVSHQLVHVSTVSDGLVALVLVHHGLALPLPGQLVVAAPDQEVHVALGEDELALHQLPGVARVEQVVDAVGVHADLPRGGARPKKQIVSSYCRKLARKNKL